MKNGVLLIFSGLPGSGKSTIAKLLAKEISGVYLRIDTIENGLKDICKMQKVEGEGYRLSYRIATDNLKVGNIVIADSVNPIEVTRLEWNNVAEKISAKYLNIEVVCSNEDEHKDRVEIRRINDKEIPGHVWPNWEQVKNREYLPWDNLLNLRIDTYNRTPAECVDQIISYLKVNLQ